MTVKFGFSLTGRGPLASREAITALATRADEFGYESIWVTDRLLIPAATTSAYRTRRRGRSRWGPTSPGSSR